MVELAGSAVEVGSDRCTWGRSGIAEVRVGDWPTGDDTARGVVDDRLVEGAGTGSAATAAAVGVVAGGAASVGVTGGAERMGRSIGDIDDPTGTLRWTAATGSATSVHPPVVAFGDDC